VPLIASAPFPNPAAAAILAKLNADSRTKAVARAAQLGLVML